MRRIGALIPCLALLTCGSPEIPSEEAAAAERAERVVASQAAEGRCRYIDRTGAVVIGPDLEIHEGFDFQDGLAGVRNAEGLVGYVDLKGELVIPFQFQDGTSHREGHAGVLKDGMCGYIDRKGKLVVPLNYDSVTNFRDGWGLVQRNGRFTFVNGKAEEIGRMFADAESFSEGLAPVAPLRPEAPDRGDSPRFGFLDVHGELVIPARYEDAEPFSENLAAVRVGGKWGYVDPAGEMVIEPRFDLAGPFHEGLAPVSVGPKMGYVDRSGALVIEPRFEADRFQSDPDEKPVHVGRFVDGLAAVRYARGPEAGVGWGFIDRGGGFVTPPIYEDAYMFSEGLARVKLEGKWGFVDRSGELVIPTRYSKAGELSQGLALVCED